VDNYADIKGQERMVYVLCWDLQLCRQKRECREETSVVDLE